MKITKKMMLIILVLMIILCSCSKKKTTAHHQVVNHATVTITLNTLDDGSVNGASVRLVNNADANLVWQRNASSSNVVFTEVVQGIYTLTVTHTGYHTFVANSFSVSEEVVSLSVILSPESEPEPKFTITNNTGVVLNSAFVRATGTVDWTQVHSAAIPNNGYITVVLAEPLSVQNRYDIRVSTTASLTSGNTYTKPNELITSGGNVVFTGADIDENVNPTVTSVTLEPNTVNVASGSTQQFSATVIGTNDPPQTVTWNVTGGIAGTNINANGLLTVSSNEINDTLTVTATSTLDTNISGTATVTVMGEGGTWNVNNLTDWNQAVNGIRNGGNNKSHTINVNVDIAYPPLAEPLFGIVTGITVLIQGNVTLSITGGGSGTLMNMIDGQTVIIRDITLQGSNNNTSALVNVWGVLQMEGNASITGNGVEGVSVSGELIMRQNSSISHNNRGGVHISSGSMIMNDNSSVRNNRNTTIGNQKWEGSGGGVFVGRNGSFTMRDNSSVSDNIVNTTNTSSSTDSRGSGGGVFLDETGYFSMEGGSISGNTAIRGGGMYVVVNSTLLMDGGEVTSNTAIGLWSMGGGIYARGNFTMRNGVISNNNSANSGGGIFLSGGDFTMLNGSISNNTSGGAGGGVFMLSLGNFNMYNGSITNNTAGGNGGGILALNVIVHNGTISNNTITSSGEASGAGVQATGNFVMHNGIIAGNVVNSSNNNAGSRGAGVVAGGFTKTGGIIYGDEASVNLRNVVNVPNARGHAVFAGNPDRWRNATADENDNSEDFGFWTND